MTDIWQHRAACRNGPAEVFFPLKIEDAAEAQLICSQRCPVREACAKSALRTRTSHGVHGGYFLPTQRTSLRRYVAQIDATQPELVLTSCASCGKEIEAKRKLVVCGSCRAHARHQSVPAGPVREHLEQLRASGWTLRAIHTVAGISQTVASRVACGRSDTVSSKAAAKLLAVQGDPPARLPGVCPVCEKDLPINGASDKCGHRGYCSKKCRAARQAVNA